MPDSGNKRGSAEAERTRALQERFEQSASRARVFADSKVKFVTQDGRLSEAGAYVLDLTPEEMVKTNTVLQKLLDGLSGIQKTVTTPVATDKRNTQAFRIDDFSDAADKLVQSSGQQLTAELGAERFQTLLRGLKATQSDIFCDFGKGVLDVSFEDRGKRLQIHEEKHDREGNDIGSSTYPADELPARYRRLLILDTK